MGRGVTSVNINPFYSYIRSLALDKSQDWRDTASLVNLISTESA